MNELQRLVTELQMLVASEITGHDADTAAAWAEDLVNEAFADQPQLHLLRIYVDEIEKKATRARDLRDKIEAVRQRIF